MTFKNRLDYHTGGVNVGELLITYRKTNLLNLSQELIKCQNEFEVQETIDWYNKELNK